MRDFHHDDDAPAGERGLEQLMLASPARRRVLEAGVAAGLGSLLAALPAGAAAAPRRGGLLGFEAIAPSDADALRVPQGYSAQVLFAWGDPVGARAGSPAFRFDASNSAAEQALQAGMHHDAIELFPLPAARGEERALLALNHEYTDDGLLHPDGMRGWRAEKVAKSQAAHGISVIEVARRGGAWRVVRPSRHARRVTAATPIRLAGPAAGSTLLATAADPAGRSVLGTLNNCAGGRTPWGTYLSGEENFNYYFAHGGDIPPALKAYGVAAQTGFGWHFFDARFDAATTPNEPNRFGWVVELDPYDPASTPVKRTALGRLKHEGATVALARDGRVAVYMGDDQAFQHVYKFVSARAFEPASREANRDLLDAGTLYVARFDAEGGEWLPLVHGAPGLGAADGFADQAAVLVHARLAAARRGATPMDRPEWIAVHPRSGEVFVALTNNARRGTPGRPGADGANPRALNFYGHILRLREAGGDAAAARFGWDVFALGGEAAGFACPDGLMVDARGVLWIQTDVSGSVLGRGPFAAFGNNQMLAADPETGEVRRFLTGPRGCEVTGAAMSPDGTSLFVNIQHPGEPREVRHDPAAPRAQSNWPDFRPDGRPRSATVVIRREDGGVVGT